MEDDQLSRSYWLQSRTSPVRYKILCSFEECFFFLPTNTLARSTKLIICLCGCWTLMKLCFFLFSFSFWSLWAGCWGTTVACSPPYAHHWLPLCLSQTIQFGRPPQLVTFLCSKGLHLTVKQLRLRSEPWILGHPFLFFSPCDQKDEWLK